MAITSDGYDGTVSDVEFAQIAQHSGAQLPVVCGRDDFAVTVNGSATRTCNVAVGSAEAPGVKVTSDAIESAVFDVVSTGGQTRWDAVVLRYNWSAGTTTLVVVKGTAAASAPQVLPSGVDLVLNSSLDQVLALVQITNGQPLPTAVADYRLQGTKVYTAPSTAALPTASVALYGSEAAVGSDRYRCINDGGGSPSWVKLDPIPVVASGTINVTGTGAPGATATASFPVGRFSTAPKVFVSRVGGAVAKAIPYVGTVTTSSLTVAAYTGDGSAIPGGSVVVVNWFAIQ